MLDGTPRRLGFALLAVALLACDAEDPRSHDLDDDTAHDTAHDAAAGETSRDAVRDGGRDVDAAPGTVDATGARDAATASRDARAQEVTEASVPADAGSDVDEARDAGSVGRDAASSAGPAAGASPFSPAFHIALRVHRADSGLRGTALASALEEMNEIWWTQASICFEVVVVRSEEPRRDGFDLWFHRTKVGCNTTANGVYCGDHDIHSLDVPSLNAADNAAWDTRQNPARTSAHELGHGLMLEHYNGFADSNDSLMSSGRQGFKLHESEITTARRRAQSKAVAGAPATPCAAVPIVD